MHPPCRRRQGGQNPPSLADWLFAAATSRAELLLAKAVKRLPKHAGLRENRAAIRAART